MSNKRYRIIDGVLRFEDSITALEDYFKVPQGVKSVDFNNVKFITKPLHLENLPQGSHIDFKNVITASKIYLPFGSTIKENMYWYDKIEGSSMPAIIFGSQRMWWLKNNENLVYLSGTVMGYLPLRHYQRKQLFRANLGVYSPGNHMTLGDPVADNYPLIVGDIDIKAMEASKYLFFDLNNLSAGTCAELGYTIAKNWHKSKEVYYMMNNPTKNFFINGLTKHLHKVDSIEEFIERVTKHERKEYRIIE